MPWFIVFPDGRVIKPTFLPPRPADARPTSSATCKEDDPFTPYYDLEEHRHTDGSYHIVAATEQQAINKCKLKGADELPLRARSGRLKVPVKK